MENNLINIPENKVFEIINNIFPRLDLENLGKFKAYSNQIIFDCDRYLYKIYEDEIDNGFFNLEIRKNLSEIYKSYGIEWDIKYFIKDNMVYTVEKREKLKLCSNEISCDKLLLNWNNTLKILEDKLRLDAISKQLKRVLKKKIKFNFLRLKLCRDAYNKPEDYAYYNDKIILLDDCDWFLAMLDENNNLLKISPIYEKVLTTVGYLVFKDNDLNQINLYEQSYKFFLYKEVYDPEKIHKLISIRESHIRDNIKFLSGDNSIKVTYADKRNIVLENTNKTNLKFIESKNG